MRCWVAVCTVVAIAGCKPSDSSKTVPATPGGVSPTAAVASAMLLPDSDPIAGADDHADDPAQATVVTFGQTVVGVLSDADDRDAFALDLTTSMRVVLQAHALGTVELELIRPDGTRAQRQGNHLQLDLDATAAGRYVLVVRSLIGAQDYALTVERTR